MLTKNKDDNLSSQILSDCKSDRCLYCAHDDNVVAFAFRNNSHQNDHIIDTSYHDSS